MLKIEKNDYVHLRSWQELCELGEVDNEGNIVLPNSYRLFQFEADLYDKWYKINGIHEGYLYKNKIYYSKEKREICELEIDKVVKHGTQEYYKLEKELKKDEVK